MLADVIADSEQMPRLVVQEVILHGGQFTRTQCKVFNLVDPLLRMVTRGVNVASEDGKPLPFIEPCYRCQLFY